VIGPATPVHIAILGLATWSLALMTFGLDDATLDGASEFRLARRVTGGFLIVVAGLFAMLWSGQIAAAITSGRLPPAVADLGLPTSPVFVLDLAFAVPLMTIAGLWLIRRDRRGPVGAVSGLTFLAILGLSVLSIFAFEAAAGLAVAFVPIVLFGLVTAAAAVVLGIAVTGSRASSATTIRPSRLLEG
jgi:hypothetical protein